MNLLLQQFAIDGGAYDPPERYNIAPTQDVAVVRLIAGKRTLSPLRWGLIPPWSDNLKVAYHTFNARSETAAEKRTFRGPMKSRRCLIPADGFYEWNREGKVKRPYLFRRADEATFAFAGLWERWEKGDVPVESCTILTTAANSLMATVHDRMPVILSPNDYAAWLNPDEHDGSKLAYLFEPFPSDDFVAYQVNPIVNNARNEGPQCIDRVDD